jgi:hypothetical protein
MLKYILALIIFVVSCIMSVPLYSVTSDSSLYVDQSNKRYKTTDSHLNDSNDSKVINIIIDKIDNNYICSKEGGVFPITGLTQIINNRNPEAKISIGELFFKDGNLITIIIK